MRKSKDSLYLRKQHLLYLPEYSIDVNGYLVGSMDHTIEEMTIPFPELDQLPLWDWMRCTNKKRNKLYYLNFSIPYTYLSEKERIVLQWSFEDARKSNIDFFGKCTQYPGKYNAFKISDEHEEFTQMREQYYLDNNDWVKTYELMNQQLEHNKSIDKILVSVNYEKDGFDIVVPENYQGSIKDVFIEVLPIMFEGKKGLTPFHVTNKYVKEIEGQRFI